jgi:PKD repeat protein
MSSLSVRGSRAGSAALAAFLAVGLLLLGLAVPGIASADTRPETGTPATVSADGLGTVQVDGVVWQMVTVGNTVYATGSFTNARPAGAAAGTSTTPRANLLAFNLTTGALVTTFNHTLNGQGRTITASPDGTRIYVGGDFTTVDGVARGHIAAFDVSTGALITTFAPTSNAAVYSLAATDTTVYAGGNFTTAGGQPRTRLAAFNASNAAVTAWAPTANHTVRGIVVSPNGQRIVFGGQFSQVNGATAIALASVNTTNGQAMQTWDYGITNAGDNGGVWSVKFDGRNAYATTYGYLVGNIEGVVAFNPDNLALVWMNDCHGDPYDTWSNGTVLYNASHTHDCETSGQFPDQNPRQWKRAIAMTVAVTGNLKATTQVPRYGSWEGRPHPSVLDWFPTIPAGTYTGQDQGTWSVTGGGNYVVFGGEFTTVNGVAQQSLVRFANTSVAPNRRGPELTTGQMRPNASSNTAGQVKVSWPQSWDMDNETLTYNVYRGTGTTPVYSVTAKSQWWNRTMMTWTDTSRAAGSTASYRVAVNDPLGNTITSTQGNTVTVASATSAYANAVLADGAAQYWRLGETTGTTAYDAVGTTNMAEAAGITRGTAGAVTGDAAITANGTTTGRAQTANTVSTPANAFSMETWVRTTSTAGGVIAQYGDNATGANTVTDRTLYVDSAGQVAFGLSARGADRVTRFTTVRSTALVTDGQWHHVVATVGTGGTTLYIDGAQVAGNAAMTSANTRLAAGYVALGSGTTTGLTNVPTSASLAGAIDEVAIYPATLTSAQVAQHYSTATGTATNASPTASFTATTAPLQVSVDATASSDSDGTIASYAWNWGDNTAAGSGVTATHPYAAAGTYTVTLTVTDNGGATATTTRSVVVPATPPANPPPTASFTATATGLQVAVNASASADTNGTISSYAWNWGDGTPGGSGVSTSHTYAGAGTYTITLTVTDNQSATGTATRSVTVAPQTAEFARDAFQRTVNGGLGNADVGGAWTAAAGATRLSVNNPTATFALPGAGNNTGGYLGSVSQTSADVTASFSLSAMPTDVGTYVYVSGRRVNGQGEYRVRVRVAAGGQVFLAFSRMIGTTESFPNGEVAVTGVTYTAGSTLNVRARVTGTGTTTITARVWASGTTEPANWQLSRTDTTAALQVGGSVGLAVHRPNATTAATDVRFTSFSARPVA